MERPGSRVRRNRSTGNSETLAEHLERATPAELAEAARIYGIGRLFDTAIVPVINEDRAAPASDAAASAGRTIP
jgi:hypothetical protein